MNKYIAVLHKEDKSAFGVSFPDFPGCVAAGDTLEEALENATEALDFHIQGMIEDGEVIPAPSAFEDIKVKDGGIVILVPYNRSAKKLRINVIVREDHLALIDKLAEGAGLDRSAFMVLRSIDESDARRRHREEIAKRLVHAKNQKRKAARPAKPGTVKSLAEA